MISGIAYAGWGVLAHGDVAADIYMANERYGNEINNDMWAFFVGIGCMSVVVGVMFLLGRSPRVTM